jgi:hypothetical protein
VPVKFHVDVSGNCHRTVAASACRPWSLRGVPLATSPAAPGPGRLDTRRPAPRIEAAPPPA